MNNLPDEIQNIILGFVYYNTYPAATCDPTINKNKSFLRYLQSLAKIETITGGGRTITYVDGIKHSINDEPDVSRHGTKYWYKNGKLNRDNDLPAVVLKSGTQFWRKNNVLHRESLDENNLVLPAIIHFNGDRAWHFNGRLHRTCVGEDGRVLPAVINMDGEKFWYRFGKLHRSCTDENGNLLPAVICKNPGYMYYNDGIVVGSAYKKEMKKKNKDKKNIFSCFGNCL